MHPGTMSESPSLSRLQRQTSRPAAPLPAPRPLKRRLSWPVASLMSFTLALGSFLAVATWAANHHQVSQAATLQLASGQLPATPDTPATSGNNPVPDERPISPAAIHSYTVPQDIPRYLTLPSLGAHGRVLSLNLLKNGQLDTPWSIYDAGWYTGSSKPGQAGAALIAGHSTGPTKEGIFGKLSSIAVGQIVQVTLGSGKVLNFRVVSKREFAYDHVDMASALVPITIGKPGLNLMTCSGSYDTKTHNYANRTIVYTEAI